jgi:hypothetical protein
MATLDRDERGGCAIRVGKVGEMQEFLFYLTGYVSLAVGLSKPDREFI